MINDQPELQDGVITLKVLKASDTEALYLMRSDKELCEKAGLKTDKNLGQTYTFIHNVARKIKERQFYYWGIFNEDILVGVISLWGLDYILKSGELGYFTGSDHLRKGYMSKAVKLVVNYVLLETEIVTVTAYVETTNKASKKLVEKLGFKMIEESIEEDMADNFVAMYKYDIDKIIE